MRAGWRSDVKNLEAFATGGLTSEDYAPQTAHDQGTVVDYVSHITVDCELAPQFFDDLKADRLYNDD